MQITVITSSQPSTLTKHITRGADGALIKTSSAHLTKGHVRTAQVGGMEELNVLLDSLAPNQAVMYGVPPVEDAPLVSEKYLSTTEGAITRSDKYFSWPKGAGVMYLDYDPAEKVLSQVELLGALFKLLPAAASCGWLWRPSASGNVYDSATGKELAGLKGQHVYLAVKDATDIKRAGEALFKRAWLAGLGRIEIAKNGAQLVRGLIDSAVWQPSRLDFAAGAVCGPGLERKSPLGLISEGGLLDTKIAIPNLEPDEESRYLEVLREAKRLTLQASNEQRADHIENVAAAQGVSPEVVRARYDVAEEKGVLANDFQVELAYDQGAITVEEILCNRDKYHNAICLDPLEPDYNNRHPVGKIYNDSKGTYLHSMAHGGRTFSLGNMAALVFQEQASDGATFKDLMADVRRDACDLSEVPKLVDGINDGPFNEPERALLRAELEGSLKDAKRLTPELKAMIHGDKSPAPRARDILPNVPNGGVRSHDLPLNPDRWKTFQTTGSDNKPVGSISNFRIMAEAYGVTAAFNVISKDVTLSVPGHKAGGALHDESALDELMSLANINKYPKSDVPGRVINMAHQNEVNPVKDWVFSRPWDTTDHIGQLISQISFSPDEDVAVASMLIRRWLLGAVACGTGHTAGCENVIVWVDELGGVGKTRFFRTLCAPELRADGVTLELSDKDSVKDAISHWLVELGELDGTFNKSDMARLKAFISKQRDDLRLPYARTYSKFPRTTAFMASVNQINFLTDDTGNRRFWPIRVEAMNHTHGVDVQQVWAQAYAAVMAGETWHLNEEENKLCADRNKAFKAISRIEDALSSRIDLEGEPTLHLTSTEVMTACGVTNAHRGELNEAARWLRGHGVKEVKRKGKRGFLLAPLIGTSVVDGAFRPTLVK